jgi:hypothetical protein
MIGTAARFFTTTMLIAAVSAGAADVADVVRTAERAVNEYMLRTQIIMSCHPIQTDADKAYFESGDAIGKAAFERLWAYLDAIDPARHEDNGDKAEQLMQQMSVDADRKAEKLFREKGCAALEDDLKALQ